uniref:Immunoglobulin V-set domain-containing protein n=1 Tax=Periophthalmus magnuspinnatus TaxID=409849 RepID=A0A3B4AWW9_9GOBI
PALAVTTICKLKTLNFSCFFLGLCDARVNNALCYGALGGTIKIQLMDSGSTTHRCIWKHNDRTVFDWKDNTVKRNEFKNRSVFNSSTGIIQIQNLTKIDNDSYKIMDLWLNGKRMFLKNIIYFEFKYLIFTIDPCVQRSPFFYNIFTIYLCIGSFIFSI